MHMHCLDASNILRVASCAVLSLQRLHPSPFRRPTLLLLLPPLFPLLRPLLCQLLCLLPLLFAFLLSLPARCFPLLLPPLLRLLPHLLHLLLPFSPALLRLLHVLRILPFLLRARCILQIPLLLRCLWWQPHWLVRGMQLAVACCVALLVVVIACDALAAVPAGKLLTAHRAREIQ